MSSNHSRFFIDPDSYWEQNFISNTLLTQWRVTVPINFVILELSLEKDKEKKHLNL